MYGEFAPTHWSEYKIFDKKGGFGGDITTDNGIQPNIPLQIYQRTTNPF